MSITNPVVKKVFDDLDRYRDFCIAFGYRFDESDLYNHKSNNYRSFQRALSGKPIRNQWAIDYEKYKQNISV